MKRKAIIVTVLLVNLAAWLPGALQMAAAVERDVQITVPDCRA